MAWINVRLISLGILFALAPTVLPAPAATTPPATSPLDKGMWVWVRDNVADDTQRHAMLAFAQSQKITRLLVYIHFEGTHGAETLGSYEKPFQTLLQEATQAHIKVEALEGGPEMGYAANRADTLHKLDVLLAFNKSQPADVRFVGFHYDIEPYLSQRWKGGDIKGAMDESLETFSEIQQRVHATAPSLTIAYDIPPWYGRKPTLRTTFRGAEKSLQEHVQDLSDYVGVMCYRRIVTGPNSVTSLCAPILAYAAKTGKRVYPAMETKELKQTPTITFFGSTPQQFEGALDQIYAANGTSPAFGGILIHQYVYYQHLMDSASVTTP